MKFMTDIAVRHSKSDTESCQRTGQSTGHHLCSKVEPIQVVIKDIIFVATTDAFRVLFKFPFYLNMSRYFSDSSSFFIVFFLNMYYIYTYMTRKQIQRDFVELNSRNAYAKLKEC